ncbi:MAG: menaquinone biosynthesis protein [Bacteroidota bacterium]|nr:menaquinone biosynthesis protein [Bacteroidota bacterium]
MNIKIAAVSYLNTIPFVYGLRQSKLIDSIDLQLDYPALCADKLINGKVDLALVPIAVIPKLQDPHIISDYCIGANGAVDTVCLYSDVPLSKIETIALDYQSKTSIALLKILLKDYWKINVKLENSKIGFEQKIIGKSAALVIGDRAFDLKQKHKYIYDLSAVWKEFTGLPFVFATWVANKKLSYDFISVFNNSLEIGLNNIEQALNQESHNFSHCKNPQDYLNNKISYHLDAKKIEAMELFLSKI